MPNSHLQVIQIMLQMDILNKSAQIYLKMSILYIFLGTFRMLLDMAAAFAHFSK